MFGILIILGLCFLIFFLVFRSTKKVYSTENSYRIGNIIGYWYIDSHFGNSPENLGILCAPHKNTFAEFLSKNKSSDLFENSEVNFITNNFWWDQMENYKKLYPKFNISLRKAIKSFKGWEHIDPPDKDTCVVHLRTGDFIDHRITHVSDIINAMDALPRRPTKFEIMNGGKRHEHGLDIASSEVIKKSEKILEKLSSSIKSKYPESEVVILDSINADTDFYRMVKAPMLVTGLGSFATMAAAANENFRLSPGFSVFTRDNPFQGNIYENWYAY